LRKVDLQVDTFTSKVDLQADTLTIKADTLMIKADIQVNASEGVDIMNHLTRKCIKM
jgi:lipopolysaccharide export system protein LptA